VEAVRSIAPVRSPATAESFPAATASRLVESWLALKTKAHVLLNVSPREVDWLSKLDALCLAVREMTNQAPDASLYLLLQMAVTEAVGYSAHHALFCAVVAQLCAERMDLPAAEADALLHAAITMNVAISAEQDQMALQTTSLSEEQRRAIAEHPGAGVSILRDVGVSDPLWLGIVRWHHASSAAEAQEADDVVRLSGLLQRVDVFTAKLSRRKSRDGTNAMEAARAVCLDEDGRPDAVGATLLRVMGLYPPGSFVRLANGETAVVVCRAAKAHMPIVASLRRSDGAVLAQPVRRDTSRREYSIVGSLRWSEVKTVFRHERVLAA
jgi:hypothetical protein